MARIETERLLLRPVELEDKEAIYEYSKSDKVGPQAGWKPHESAEETLEVMKLIFIDKDFVWAVIRKCDKRLMGTIGLIPDAKRENEKVKMLGYAIGEEYWGFGYMTEAAKAVVRYGFEEAGLSLISSYCYPHNLRSKRVIEKCRMTYEGRLREAEELYDGNVYDALCFSVSAGEYFNEGTDKP